MRDLSHSSSDETIIFCYIFRISWESIVLILNIDINIYWCNIICVWIQYFTLFGIVNLRKNVLEIHHSSWIDDFPLTEIWFSGAEKLIEQFLWKTVDAIDASPYKRCIQTIEPLSQDRSLTPMIDERIAELDVGDLDRTPWRLSWDKDRKLTDIPLWKVGESLLHCRYRVWSFLDEMKEKHRGKSVVICSHGNHYYLQNSIFLTLIMIMDCIVIHSIQQKMVMMNVL